jgi:hypothetical protein
VGDYHEQVCHAESTWRAGAGDAEFCYRADARWVRQRFFFEERSKKLLLTGGRGIGVASTHRSKSFFAAFFSKKEALI